MSNPAYQGLFTEGDKAVSEPSELEVYIAKALAGKDELLPSVEDEKSWGYEQYILMNEARALREMLWEATERRLRLEYFGKSSVSTRDSTQERID